MSEQQLKDTMGFQDQLVEKYKPLIENKDFGEIKDRARKRNLAQVFENMLKEGVAPKSSLLQEDATLTPNVAGFDPVIISMLRRSMPRLIANDICGVQALTMPTGLIFARKARYTSATGDEALFTKVKANFSGDKTKNDDNYHDGSKNPFAAADLTDAEIGSGQVTATAEADNAWNTMTATVEKVTAVAKTRQLKSIFSMELQQDWQALHGVSAEVELSNILAQEILVEKNQEIVRTIYDIAILGAQGATTPGVFNLRQDSDGRWSAERFKGLLFQVNREANKIALDTLRGRGNRMICSADVASALQMAGILDYAPALQAEMQLDVDLAGTTYVGNIGRMQVYVDPYLYHDGCVVGYKGVDQYDAGLFYAPYIELQPARAVDPATMHNVIGYKSRYAIVANPLTEATQGKNIYYRKFGIKF